MCAHPYAFLRVHSKLHGHTQLQHCHQVAEDTTIIDRITDGDKSAYKAEVQSTDVVSGEQPYVQCQQDQGASGQGAEEWSWGSQGNSLRAEEPLSRRPQADSL